MAKKWFGIGKSQSIEFAVSPAAAIQQQLSTAALNTFDICNIGSPIIGMALSK